MMKKILCTLLILILVFNSFTHVFAENFNRDTGVLTITEVRLQERLCEVGKDKINELKKLGFDETTIMFLTDDEINDIIENQYNFIERNESNTLFISHETDFSNGDKLLKTYVVEITKNEIVELRKDKDKFLNKMYNELKANTEVEPTEQYIPAENSSVISPLASPQTISESIDYAVLYTGVTAYDKSTSTYIEKRLGYDFQWEGKPLTSSYDALGLSHTGAPLGFTNISDSGGSYTYYFGNQWNDGDDWISVDPVLNGAEAQLTLFTYGYGRIYVDIGNSISSITPDAYFSVLGQYGHAIVNTTVAVSVGYGSISFTPTSTSEVKKSTTVQLSYIKTY